ncbi:MAG: ATP-binding protein [Deltaproteobacteria bacterium]|nr:ATP-binding protein [Deltaproteobacteria bacterium]
MYIRRHLNKIAFSSGFGRQMRFVTGPRQTGKTTVAKHFIEKLCFNKLYYNWDNRRVRDDYIKDNHFFVSDLYNESPDESGRRWILMDEIHKYPNWKNILKDFFDCYGEDAVFIITGSARLDMMRKSGDSLAGRYFTFRLNPVTLQELAGSKFLEPPKHASILIKNRLDSPIYKKDELAALLRFSGFPEPLLAGTIRFHTRWRRSYLDTLVREDLRELTQIRELEKTAVLMHLLPDRISAPLSINSLSRDLACSFATTANYLKALELGYLIFRISPYHKKIARSLKKEQKTYFYDWTRVTRESARFENYVAVELKVWTDLWTDAGTGEFNLYYIRDRDGRETDFLITRDAIPWLLVEARFSSSKIDYHHKKNRAVLGNIPFVQVLQENNVTEKYEDGIYQMSASRFFA